jgi:integrase
MMGRATRHLPGHDALRLAAWPSADRVAYQRARQGGNLVEDGGAAAAWRPATDAARVGIYGRWLGHLARIGVDLAAESGPDRLTTERVAGYVRFLREDRGRAPDSVMGTLGHLHGFAQAVWPDGDWRWLGALHARHQRLAEPVRYKEARVVPQQELLRLGCDLMVDAVSAPPAPRGAGPTQPALRFRDGLIIALLAMRPLRRNNFLALSVGTTLRREPDEGWLISFPGSMTKNHAALTQPFPEVLVPALENYLGEHRPVLAAAHGRSGPATVQSHPPGDRLWLSRWGAPLTAGGLQVLVDNHTRARFGHAVNPHLFRDCAATSLAEENPDHVRFAADLLGHRSFATTQRFYIVAGQRRALRSYQAVIARHRRQVRRAANFVRRSGGDAQGE